MTARGTAFVEVKTRSSSTAESTPEDAVNADKRRNLSRMARQFLRSRRIDTAQCRFDVLAIESRAGKKPVVRLHKSAFGMFPKLIARRATRLVQGFSQPVAARIYAGRSSAAPEFQNAPPERLQSDRSAHLPHATTVHKSPNPVDSALPHSMCK